ncbi:MAG: cyclodeaminase/cyclohydrolase family protein, partial [Candidatus Bipolaricaulota bacterium]|nr:cyclodeaminase/cyclohydrolase family protein [Candidatus Bipolaricaulota bacterium]
MSIRDESVWALLEGFSAATPTPGGGSAAAFVGSVAASLVAMVAGLTVGKRAYQSVEPEMQRILSEATQLRDELLELAERDSEAFNAVMAAYKLPKETESDRAAREQAIQAALKGATEIPYQTALRCSRVLELAEVVVTRGNKSALSDGGAAAALAESALQAALLNIAINLASLSDETIKLEVTRVNLLFTVTDRRGRFVKNLSKDDIDVIENKRRQNIIEFVSESNIPLRIAMLVDVSNSIRQRFRFELEAAGEFLQRVIRPGVDKALIYAFHT